MQVCKQVKSVPFTLEFTLRWLGHLNISKPWHITNAVSDYSCPVYSCLCCPLLLGSEMLRSVPKV